MVKQPKKVGSKKVPKKMEKMENMVLAVVAEAGIVVLGEVVELQVEVLAV